MCERCAATRSAAGLTETRLADLDDEINRAVCSYVTERGDEQGYRLVRSLVAAYVLRDRITEMNSDQAAEAGLPFDEEPPPQWWFCTHIIDGCLSALKLKR